MSDGMELPEALDLLSCVFSMILFERSIKLVSFCRVGIHTGFEAVRAQARPTFLTVLPKSAP